MREVVDGVENHGAALDALGRARRRPADHPNRVPVAVAIEGSGRKHMMGVLGRLAELDVIEVVEEQRA